jgi:hypothetical protein
MAGNDTGTPGELHWDHGGAAEVVSALGADADAIASPAAGLGAGAPAGVGPDVESMLDDLGATWQRDLGRRSAAVGVVRDAMAAQDAAVGGTDRNLTI